MRILAILRTLFILLMPVAFFSCGGGTDYAGGGVGGTGISVGKITAFGSVFVNGVEFETTGASITKDGVNVNETDLRVGMIVTVHGTFNPDGTTGTASNIEFKDNLEGPVTSIDAVGTKTFVVLGQTVQVDGSTVFENSILDTKIVGDIGAILGAIAAGNIVEVSGLVQADSTILASFIELKAQAFTPGDKIELKGEISNLDETPGTFRIGNLVVDYSKVSPENLPSSGLSNGLFVEVQSTSGFDNDGRLIASKVEAEEAELKEGDKVEIEGFAKNITTLTEFEVRFEIDGQPVQTAQDTRFKGGKTASDITENVRLEVEGKVENGVIIAREVSFESDGDSGSSSEEGSLSGSEGTSINIPDDGGSESGSGND